MRNRPYSISACVVALVVCLCGAVAAQQEKKAQTSVRFTSGVSVVFTSETDPPGRERMLPGSVQVRGSENVVHRIYLDRENKIYFGYDLEVEPVADSDQYKLIIKPLSEPPILITPPPGFRSGAGAANGGQAQGGELRLSDLTSLALPKFPQPQTVHDGDTLALDVLVNPHTGVRIIDLIRVSSKGIPPQAQPQGGEVSAGGGGGAAIDLTPEMIQLHVANSNLFVNGQKVVGTDEGKGPGVAGALVWFYLPDYGRFILSLTPREGYDFLKIGVVEGRKLSFTADGNRFEWVSTSPVVPGVDDTLNLWVLHDPQYRPDVGPEQSPYLVGAADKINYLLKKR